MCKGEGRRGLIDTTRDYRLALARAGFWEHADWMLPFFTAPIGIPALIGSIVIFVVRALRRRR